MARETAQAFGVEFTDPYAEVVATQTMPDIRSGWIRPTARCSVR
jgi:hypothetical protein